MARVTAIIPTFNRAALLSRAIESVLRQTFADFELLIVDDGSSDDTAERVAGFEDPRIEYIRHDVNRGASAARNTGLARAHGEFVAFLDSDDEWLDTKLEKQISAFADGDERLGVVYSAFEKIGWRYEPESRRWRGDIGDRILVHNFVGTASTPMIRRTCFEGVGNFDEAIYGSEDWDLWIRLARDWEFEYIPENLVHYHPQEVSLTSDRDAVLRSYERLFEKHEGAIQSLDRSTRAEHSFYRGRIYLARRKLAHGVGWLLRALAIDPGLLPELWRYLFVETGRKMRGRLRAETRGEA